MNEPGGHGEPNGFGTSGAIGNEPSRHRGEDNVTITVKNQGNGKSFPMDANLNWSQDDLRRAVAKREEDSSGQMRLTSGGRELSGSASLRQAGIRSGSTVNSVLRLRGG